MRHEWELARSFMKSARSSKLYHPHILLSIAGIAVGVCFLIFALSLYDGYVKKIESIVFSFYPQVTLQKSNAEKESVKNDDWLLTGEINETEKCAQVCCGDIILEDQTLDKKAGSTKQQFDLEDFAKVKQELLSIEGVRHVSPIIFEEAEFNISYTVHFFDKKDNKQSSYTKRNKNAQESENIVYKTPLRVLGVQPQSSGDSLAFVPEIDRTITDPGLLAALTEPGKHRVIISAELQDSLLKDITSNLGKGKDAKIDKLILAPVNNLPGNKGKKSIELLVAGVFKLGMHKIAENMIITSLKAAQEIFHMPQAATFAGLALDDPYQAEMITDKVKICTAEDSIQSYHWMAVAADMFNSLSFYRTIIIIVLLMSLLITSFNIYTTLDIMILERKKQIGTLLSMGMKKGSLYRVFLIISQKEALAGTVAGILAGVCLGYLFSDYFNRSMQAFVQIQDAGTVLQPGTMLFILVFVALVCGSTAALATRKAARLDPVDALRSE